MTYLDYINQFWQTQDNVQFSPNEAYLYFYLLKECNTQAGRIRSSVPTDESFSQSV